MFLVQVYVTNASLNVDHPFTYTSDSFVANFVRVKVKFNKSNTIALVYKTKEITNLQEYEKKLGYRLLPILDVLDEKAVLSQELFDLAVWLSKTTLSPLISCLNCMLPKALKTSKNFHGPVQIKRIQKIDGDFLFTRKQKEIYDSFYDGMKSSDAKAKSNSIYRKLVEIGALKEYLDDRKFEEVKKKKEAFKILTEDQQNAFDKIVASDKLVSLLFGVTGSGKTEVYLHLAKHYLNQGKQVLILVPEIALTPQMIERVKERFDDVVFYHSELSDQERYEQYMRIAKNQGKIVVGTRSSIFLPFQNLGLIIVDEEHDTSYHQDSVPTYSCKNVAFKRAIDMHGKVLLASATPSLESYTRALKKEYELVELKHRINLKLPKIELIDLTKQIKKKDSYIISAPLKKAMEENLSQHKQIILLLNRRGYSPIVKCAECGSSLMCKDCDTPLTYHKDEGILKCHQCGRVYAIPKVCPKCHESNLLFYGFGTKKVEEEMKNLFPNARIERMDRDSVTKKNAHEQILHRFGNGEIDILIGTQMIAKGLDFPNVTLVGILNGDAGLLHQDYNSAKMTFDLLMQASGRSGRAEAEGKVIIQAFNVDHYALKAVLNQDYVYFYNIEMNYRYKANYPPYTHIVSIQCLDSNLIKKDSAIANLFDSISKLNHKVYRPMELPKIKGQYRSRILIMDKDLVSMLKDIHEVLEEYLSQKSKSNIKVEVDPLYLD